MKFPTVFLDRDGTINEEFGYINHPSRFKLIPEAGNAIKKLNDKKILAVVITNQAGIARGYFTKDILEQTHEKLEAELNEKFSAHLDGIYYCPHHPAAVHDEYRIDCNCRKPKTGLIEQAVAELPIDTSFAYVVGDRNIDTQFAKKLKLKSVMVLTGYGLGEYTYQRNQWTAQPDFICNNLEEAVDWILNDLSIINRGMKKLKTRDEIKSIIKKLQQEGKKVVFANGCFDLLHGGHVSYLEDSRQQGDILILGLNSDKSIKQLKGDKRPVLPEEQRVEILSSLSCIDYIMLFDEARCDGILRELRPDVHAKGTDYTTDTVPERQTAIELGIQTFIAGAPKENATKDIISLIIERETKK